MEWTEERRRDGMDQGRDREGRNGPRKGRRGDGMDRGKEKGKERQKKGVTGRSGKRVTRKG